MSVKLVCGNALVVKENSNGSSKSAGWLIAYLPDGGVASK
jgi:hypothetical protein